VYKFDPRKNMYVKMLAILRIMPSVQESDMMKVVEVVNGDER
jgi:hypothetical protein